MASTAEDIISELLFGAVEELDIPEELQDEAERAYERVGDWLADTLSADGDWHVYPQGSMRLGTVVRPSAMDEYDVDVVAVWDIAKERVTKRILKEALGISLSQFVEAHREDADAPTSLNARRRCWTLQFRKPFHVDVMPAIPDPGTPPTGIQITDRGLVVWLPSNPIGFANWFYSRMGPELKAAKMTVAKRYQVDVDDLPDWRARRTTLQRVVQVLKLHRNQFFAGNLEMRPASIIVTTLAAHAYRGDKPLFDAVMEATTGMSSYVQRDGGRYLVCNPVQPDENFADRWAAEPGRAAGFFTWIEHLKVTLDTARRERGGLHLLAARLQEDFGVDVMANSLSRFGERHRNDRSAGRLTVGASGMLGTGSLRVQDHTFHGDDRPKKFADLRADLYERSPESKARVTKQVERLTEELGLADLRTRAERTQAQIAGIIGTSQSGVSRIERQHDLRVSTLSDYVAATGGRLRMLAEYPDGQYEVRLPVLMSPQNEPEPRAFQVVWQNPRTRQLVHVGRLAYTGARFIFSYVLGAELDRDFEPFPAFPDFARSYEAERLFSFFADRIASDARHDYDDQLATLGLTRVAATPVELLARTWGATPHDTIQVVPDPVVTSDGSEVLLFLVSGVRHVDADDPTGVSDRIARLRSSHELILRDEPGNPNNSRAVVLEAAGERVGWVPDYLLDYVHKMRDEGRRVRVIVEHANGPEIPWHLRLLCRLEVSASD